MGRPTVFPTGTTIYDPEKCYNGYKLFTGMGIGVMLIDMNGKCVRCWKGMNGFPAKMLPGGYMLASLGSRDPQHAYQDQSDVTMVDWDGNIVWSFNKNQQVTDNGEPEWNARQHHDYQLEGNPVGYFVPGMESSPDFQKMLILTHDDVKKPRISPQNLLDDRLIEIDREGNITWEWSVVEHFNEFGFSELQKNVIYRNPNIQHAGPEGQGDLFHINCASYLGPNKWYDAGDERFKPENIIMDSREANIMWIIDHETGKVVWKVGPDYTATKEERLFETIVGPHHTHMIPKGLPGEGNILVFDNGGWAGYGAPNPCSPTGEQNALRAYSRVTEFDPVSMEIVWECNPATLGKQMPFLEDHFYSPYISSAQRLPNGNTLITQGSDGRLFEVTPDFEIVWEYISPYFGTKNIRTNMVYRSYRYPYDWAPQAEKPEEVAIEPMDNLTWRMPGAAGPEPTRTVAVSGANGYNAGGGFCVTSDD